MLIWLIQRAESTPQDPNSPRAMRMGMVADYLVRKGHQVIWWTSTFNHYSKTQRFGGDVRVRIGPLYSIQYLHTAGYKKNISLKRMVDNYFFSKKFESMARMELNKPDLIFCSFPILNVCLSVLKYTRQNNIPWVIDVRDLWPDALVQRVHISIKPFFVFFTFPITVFSLGLFLLVINAGMIALCANLVDGFVVKGFFGALLFSIILSLSQSVVYKLAGENK